MIIDGKIKYKGMWKNNCPHGKGESNLQDC